jgi:hypothetical protein
MLYVNFKLQLFSNYCKIYAEGPFVLYVFTLLLRIAINTFGIFPVVGGMVEVPKILGYKDTL